MTKEVLEKICKHFDAKIFVNTVLDKDDREKPFNFLDGYMSAYIDMGLLSTTADAKIWVALRKWASFEYTHDDVKRIIMEAED